MFHITTHNGKVALLASVLFGVRNLFCHFPQLRLQQPRQLLYHRVKIRASTGHRSASCRSPSGVWAMCKHKPDIMQTATFFECSISASSW